VNSDLLRPQIMAPRISRGSVLAARCRNEACRNGDQRIPDNPARCLGMIPCWDKWPLQSRLLMTKTAQQAATRAMIGEKRLITVFQVRRRGGSNPPPRYVGSLPLSLRLRITKGLRIWKTPRSGCEIAATCEPKGCLKDAFGLPQAGWVWHTHRVKSLTEHLWFELPARRGFVNITDTVEGLVQKSGVQEGLCLVNATQIYPLPAMARWCQ